MKLLALATLSVLLFTTGCKPDAAIRRGAVVDQPTPNEPPPVRETRPDDQQTPQTKVR